MAGMNLRAQEGGEDVPAAGQITDESALLLGEEGAGEAAPEITPLTSFGVGDFLRMVLVLALVVGLIYGVFHFIKKAGGPRDSGMRFIRVLETRPLAGNRHLHLVEIGNEVLLVGSAENGVSLVSQVSDRETLDGIQLAASRAAPPAGSFADTLKGFFSRTARHPLSSPSRKEEEVSAETSSSGAGSTEEISGMENGASMEFMKKQKARLKKLF
ncbi:MAG: flagellar biosynthetic protein FliO [Spirochaetales bacterium]|jgi:flagellar protein FliO/FliZ|nr:flagellar biosynthetic protein FliO [Spirochaetales bacterium]